MVKLVPVIHEEDLVEDVRDIYKSAFPPDERRNWDEIIQLIQNPLFCINLIFREQKLIGLISTWNLPEFIFIEHFAICSSERGKGYGTEVIKQITSNGNSVILEVEEPKTGEALNRIRFYERLRFCVSGMEYFQPPYSAGKKNVKMLLMRYPYEIEIQDFEGIKSLLYKHVYKIAMED
jgi:hypothetical protein